MRLKVAGILSGFLLLGAAVLVPTFLAAQGGFSGGGGAGLTSPVGVADGGTGATSFSDGSVLLGAGTSAVSPMATMADGEFIVGNGTTAPVLESGATARTSMGAAHLDVFLSESVPGTAATATGTDAVGIGDGAVAGNAANDNAVLAIGANSTATGVDSIAIGQNADATGSNGSIAIGGSTTDDDSANATALGAIAIGQFSDATGTGAVGLGRTSQATADQTVALGQASTASAADAIALGSNADATGTNSIAIGGDSTDATSADATAANAVAIGVNTLADATEAVALGDSADAGGVGAIAIGDTANASTGDSIAIGTDSVASTNINAIAIGQFTDATGNASIAIGGSGTDSSSADAVSLRAVAIGNNALADATDAAAFGTNADAGGTSSVALGDTTSASADRSIAIGDNAAATGANCIAIGGNTTTSDSADCSAADSIAIGQHVIADDIGEFAFASGEFAAQSDAHTSIFVLRNNTTDATQTELFADASAGDISVPSDCTLIFSIDIVARQTDADDVSAGYSVSGVMDNNAGTTALVGSIIKTTISEDVASWDATITADDSNDGINVLVTGAVGDAVRWVARAEIVEVCG